MDLSIFFKRAEKLTVDNSPLILTALGVVGVVGTAVLTAKATFKAAEILRKESHEIVSDTEIKYDPPTGKEKFDLVWRVYVPPVAMGTASVLAIIGANRVSTRRAAALAAAYSMSEKAYAEYKDKVVEKIGQNKEQKVRDELAQDRVNAHSPGTVIITDGLVLCFEQYTGRYFESSMERLRKAENDMNARVYAHGGATLSDFYEVVGLEYTSVSSEVGWDHDHPCNIEFSTVMSPDQRPCIAFDYMVWPIRDLNRFH